MEVEKCFDSAKHLPPNCRIYIVTEEKQTGGGDEVRVGAGSALTNPPSTIRAGYPLATARRVSLVVGPQPT